MLCIISWGMTGCKGEPCYTPTPREEVQEEFMESVDEGLDEMEATEEQRTKVRAEAKVLVGKMLDLRKDRYPLRHALIDEFQKPTPDAKRVKELAHGMSAPAAALYEEVVDESLKLWSMFERDQRHALAEHLNEPYKPLEESWIVDQVLAYQLGELEATPKQREMVEALKKEYYFKANVLMRQGWRDRQLIYAELKRAEPDAKKIKGIVRAQATRYDRLVDQLIEDGEGLLKTMNPDQRAKLNDQLDRARVCEDAQGW